MAAPGRTTSIEIVEDVVIRETTVVRPDPPPPPPPEPRGVSSRIEITTGDPMGGSTVMAVGGPNMNVRATISNEGANMQVLSGGGSGCITGNVAPPQPQRTSSSTRFERRVLIADGTETVEEYENGRLVRKTINGKEQPLQ
ncbi:T-cell leukemia homeobox protein 3-like [Ornithodoros turicata]|uniref:T-cell leukemia homeobox protein 3-like n=1 Tax=Ornithodoros turicata TaxID=34597 RepID=UPI00313906B1